MINIEVLDILRRTVNGELSGKVDFTEVIDAINTVITHTNNIEGNIQDITNVGVGYINNIIDKL